MNRCIKTNNTRADHVLGGRFSHDWDDKGSAVNVIGKSLGPASNEGRFNFVAVFNVLRN